jgi:hypothetical protein
MSNARFKETVPESGYSNRLRKARDGVLPNRGPHRPQGLGMAQYPSKHSRKRFVVSRRERPTRLAFGDQLANGAHAGR